MSDLHPPSIGGSGKRPPPADATAAKAPLSVALRRLTPLLALALFAISVWFLDRELNQFHLRDVLQALRLLPIRRIILAVGCTVAGYMALCGYDVLGFRYAGRRLPLPTIVLAAFSGYAFSNALGWSLFTGTPIRFRIYSAAGVPAVDVAKVVGFSLATFWLGFLSLGGLALLLDPTPVVTLLPVSAAMGRGLGIVVLAPVVAYLVAAAVGAAPIRFRGWEMPLPQLRIALAQIAVSVVDWSFSGAVLFVLLPEHGDVSFSHFLALFLVAQASGLLSHVPGGLGVFDTAILLLLPSSIDGAAAAGALLVYRAVYYLLPLVAAALSLAATEVSQHRRYLRRWVAVSGERLGPVVPSFLAALAVLAGTTLLLTGALPSLHGRLVALGRWLPLPLIELSHLLGSLAGLGLLLLARGLQRRLDGAYLATAVLLALGIVFSLARGLDYGPALFLALLLVALLPWRREFHRHARLTGESWTPGWLALIAIVVGASLWLGFFAHKHVEYSNDLWWRFTLHGDAPRFLRASVAAAGLTLLLALDRLLRPLPPEPTLPDAAALDKVETLVRRSPRTYAYLALLGDKNLLFNPSDSAFLMYRVQGRSWVVMGDPVGPASEHKELVWRFRELCDRHDGWPVFYEVAGEAMPLYVDLGLTFLHLGETARVPLHDFALAGSSRKHLRHIQRKLVEREGCTFRMYAREEVPSVLPTLRSISDNWLAEKGVGEKGFSLGFFDEDYLRRVPVATISQRDRVVAFANVWPGGEKEELTVDLMRFHHDAPNGAMDLLFIELMLWGRDQGYHWFNLGMAPLSGLEDRALAPAWNRIGAFLYRHGEHFYNFQGLRAYKSKFDPVWEPRYLASPGGLILPQVLANLATLIGGGLKGLVAR